MGKVTIWKQMSLGNGQVADVAQVEQPHRPPSIESDYIVPALQALTSGLVVGSAVAALLAVVWHVALWPTLPAAVAICAGLGWLLRLQAMESTLYRTESMAVIGAPQPAAPPAQPPQPAPLLLNPAEARAKVRLTSDQAERARHQTELVAFVRRCATVGTSESAQGITPAARAAYLVNRDALLALGLAAWRNPDQKRLGWELTVTPAQAVVMLHRHVA